MNKKLVVFHVALGIIIGFNFYLNEKVYAAPKQQSKKIIPKEQPKTGGTLVFGLGKEPGALNPFVATISSNQFVKETSYESLLTTDDDGKILPNLSEKYDIASGGKVITLHLRKDVRFHNGKEMKADDVVWSANHVKNPKNGAYGQNVMNDVRSVEKIDDYTIRFTLANASVTFLSNLTNIRMLPVVPADSLKTGQIKLEANKFVPGTGPFIIEKYQTGFDTELKKFPEYWGTPAYLDKLIFRPITDVANRFNALRTGDIQMADRLSILDANRVKNENVKGIKMLSDPMGGYLHLIFNYANPFLRKPEMRKAIFYATDKQRLIDEAFFGAGTKTDLMMDPKGIWGKAANLPPFKRDLVKAKELLKAAGYNGQELVFPGRTSAANFLESYQRILGEAGIKVKIELYEAGIMKERLMEGKYDLYVDGGDNTSDPVSTMLPYYYTDKVEKGRYSNSQVDQWFDKLDKEFDAKKRLIIFKDLAQKLYSDVADIPLCFEVRYVGMSDKVHSYNSTKGQDYPDSGIFFKQVWLK